MKWIKLLNWKSMTFYCKNNLLLFFHLLVILSVVSCSGETKKQEARSEQDLEIDLGIHTDLVIGEEDQPDEHQLGRPVSVRTDEEGHIYVADQASLTIKVFDAEGHYLKSIGRRGRGPGEFLDINMMGMTSEGQFIILDRGNLRFTILSKEGEGIAEFPIEISSQYYPKALAYSDGQTIGLYLSTGASASEYERELLHVYDTDFKENHYSFAPFHQLELEEDMFAWTSFIYYKGSLALSKDKSRLIYAPGIYHGTLYVYGKRADGRWEFKRTLKGVAPRSQPYQIYASDAQYKAAQEAKEPGISTIHYGNGKYMGKINSMEAGIFHLEDGRIIHFFAEWNQQKERTPDSDYHTLDIRAQIFDKEGRPQAHGFVNSVNRNTDISIPIVNWKDKQDRFYLLDTGGTQIPTVQRITIDLPDSPQSR